MTGEHAAVSLACPPCRKEKKHDSIGYVETPNNLSKSEEELLVS
jgi:hypothetical protein